MPDELRENDPHFRPSQVLTQAIPWAERKWLERLTLVFQAAAADD